MTTPRHRARLLAAALLLAIGGTAQAAAICSIIVNDTTFYVSEPFAYESKDPLFDDGIADTSQAKDFEAHVRRQYGIRGEVRRACHVHEEGELRKDGSYDVFGTTFRYIQTGYVPKAG